MDYSDHLDDNGFEEEYLDDEYDDKPKSKDPSKNVLWDAPKATTNNLKTNISSNVGKQVSIKPAAQQQQ